MVIIFQHRDSMDKRRMTEMKYDDSVAVPLGRRARKALAVRRALFDAGLMAFERQPIGLVSVLDITETADVAKGVFYLQFRSKDDYLLALWEDVKGRFLDEARSQAIDRRSEAARLGATVGALLDFATAAPSATRFWFRMSGFLPDEIGEPGHLTRIRQSYLQQLAALISGRRVANLTDRDLRIALLVDTLGWAAISAELHDGTVALDSKALLKSIRASLPGRAD